MVWGGIFNCSANVPPARREWLLEIRAVGMFLTLAGIAATAAMLLSLFDDIKTLPQSAP
jgi:hypothetical protein